MTVHHFPQSTTLTPEQALDSAKNQAGELKRVIVIGEYEDGGLYIGSSRLSCAEALWLIKRAELYTLNPYD